MPKFEKKYCYCMWDDELKGKRCFVADDINVLQRVVEVNDTAWLRDITGKSTCPPFPFSYIGNYYRFCYHDPYYELKLAYEQGRKIEFLCKDASDAWKDWSYTPDPKWLDGYEYRIQPDEPEESKPVTNRELARWLARGNGECYLEDDSGWHTACRVEWEYTLGNESKYVCDVMVRKWEDKVWHKPTREYMGFD